MQWTNETRSTQTDVQEDVYAGVKTSYLSNRFAQQDNQEFSLASIKERLGAIDVAEDADVAITSDDLKPSTQTLNMSYQRNYTAEKVHQTSKLSTRTKVAIASYVMVVLALVLGITLCSVYINGAFGSAVALDAAYAEAASKVSQLDEQLRQDDYASLMERAEGLGYIDASKSNTMEYTEIETRPAQNFNVQSNWFDALCDWLCSVFGV